MKAFIIYDSLYGNTEKIAQAIAGGLTGEIKVVRVGEADPAELTACDMLIIGSPVHGGRATPELDAFIKKLPPNSLEGVSVAAFDTRFEYADQGVGLRLLMSVTQYAAQRIAKALVKKGGILVAEPEGFIVEEKEGPLRQGELERATKWATQLSIAKKVPSANAG